MPRGARAGFPVRRGRWPLLVAGCLGLAAACSGPRENSLLQAERQRQQGALRGVQHDHARLLAELRAGLAEDEAAIQQLRDRAAEAQGRRRDLVRLAEREDAARRGGEAALVAARAQVAAQQQEIEALHAVLAEVQVRELKLKSLQEQQALLQAQIEQAAQQTAALQGELAAAQARLLPLRAAEVAVQQALQQAQPPAPAGAAAAAAVPAAPAKE